MMILVRCHRLIEPGYQDDVEDQVHEGKRQKPHPAQMHHLIVAEAGQRPPDPDKEEDKQNGLGQKAAHPE
tara:strand:+ start:776 stop:985 length:210 start_codon:yes stop_codon:yes gene_type:complete